MLTFLFRALVLPAVLVYFIGCKDYRKIDELTRQKDSVQTAINLLISEIAFKKSLIDSLHGEKKRWQDSIRIFMDSSKRLSKEDPRAFVYINTFDENPILIIKDILREMSDEERFVLTFTHLDLFLYAIKNSEQIIKVRNQLNSLDERKEIVLRKEKIIDSEIAKHKGGIDENEKSITSLTQLQHDLDQLLLQLNL